MLSVALTGNIAAGKSTVAELFRRWGATVIDADGLAREAQGPGTAVLAAITARFGPEILQPDGSLDRAALRRRVMADPAALAELNAMVHPEVRRRRAELARAAAARGDRIVVSEVPLLFETADRAGFDTVVLVDAPADVRRRRLLENRDLSREEAVRMLAAQLPADTKRSRSDYVIDNNADLAALERAAQAVWQALLVASGQPPG